jgi:rubrerythrin
MTSTPAYHGGALVAPQTLASFMAHAYAMELEASQRYSELADAMETHNNHEVAKLFRTMAEIETKHAAQLMAQMGWREPPAMPPGPAPWGGFEAPETAPVDDVHYLMQPYHALQIALASEQRAEHFFARLADVASIAEIREAAAELRDEERAHVELVKQWMAKVEQPARDWAVDPDPPRYTE